MNRIILIICGMLLGVVSCTEKAPAQETGAVPVKWKKTQVREDLVWYKYQGYETVTRTSQIINVLELNLDSDKLELEFQYYPDKTTLSSAISLTDGAIAGTNASFGTPHTFIRTGGTTWCDISQADPSDSGNWVKHEAAVWMDGTAMGCINCEGDPFGAIDTYKNAPYPNLFSSEPLLIENHEYVQWVGKESFMTKKRHPRTAVAMTDSGTLLLITVDGRWFELAGGMTIVELRDFIQLNFGPKWAVNMDGGGSTTMFVSGYGRDGIVNYPCNENGASSGEYVEYLGSFSLRNLPTFFIIREK